MADSVLPYFDPSVQLAGVQYEYNHKQTVYGTSTILVHRTRSGTIISCLICTVLPTGVPGWTGVYNAYLT